jgi:hypothetical protein
MATQKADEQSNDVRDIMIEAARLQLAGLSSITKFWSGWADAADKYAQALGDELTKIDEGSTKSKEIVGRLADLSREYLRNISKLPGAAVEQFNNETNKLAKSKGQRTRVAKAKE